MGGHTIDSDVENIGFVEEAAPEPREVLSRHIFDRAEEIRRCRMLVCPPPNVLPKGAIERLRSDHVIAQREENRPRLPVSNGAQGTSVNMVRAGHNGGRDV